MLLFEVMENGIVFAACGLHPAFLCPEVFLFFRKTLTISCKEFHLLRPVSIIAAVFFNQRFLPLHQVLDPVLQNADLLFQFKETVLLAFQYLFFFITDGPTGITGM